MRLTDIPLRPLDQLREWLAVRLAPWAIYEDVLEHHGRSQRVSVLEPLPAPTVKRSIQRRG